MRINILAIESSCDETAVALISNGKILNNLIASQMIHAAYGGVVPELASREHEKTIGNLAEQALLEAGLNWRDLDAVAVTQGPGLMGSLLVGHSFAKGVSVALGIPLILVNHMQAHIMAHFIPERKPGLPFLCLTVSGGHTQLVLMDELMRFNLLGQTRDDAVGEAFDKGAKMLGLPYPGGPLIDRYAAHGNPEAFPFSVSKMPGLDFSFSGIKTSLLYFIRDKEVGHPGFVEKNLPDICASYQRHLLAMLMEKLELAASTHQVKSIGIAGGVAANSGLRKLLAEKAKEKKWDVFIPEFSFCADNAAMIAITAHYKFLAGDFAALNSIPVASLSADFELNPAQG
ncbi:MAG: tRNA (adenosine(37)-N6)-threonylcarbamoyltransferase complex transferase subunit TsaD [Bacteroidetes bacterium]|nr:tRNA (adenosine(37)-N6)-threonylcarbamoyltransferase complex transferase subunit TsaD [Bacteroidota bacterium]